METFYYNSPVGSLKITIQSKIVVGIHFLTQNFTPTKPKTPFGRKVEAELNQYFKGNRTHFTIPVQFEGTDFQKDVWRAVKKVKYSQTLSYKDIAERIHRPKAVRAVGSACGKNPLPIIIPCHRITASGGKLGGYGGGHLGLEKKKWLLDHEIRK